MPLLNCSLPVMPSFWTNGIWSITEFRRNPHHFSSRMQRPKHKEFAGGFWRNSLCLCPFSGPEFQEKITNSEPPLPTFGSAEGGHPDLFRFVPNVPFSSALFRFAFLVFLSTPICSDLFCSEQIRTISSGKPPSANPFCKSPTITVV